MGMRLRRIISTQIRREGDGLSVHAAIDAVIAANVNEPEGDAQAPSPGRGGADEQRIKEVRND